MRRLLLCGTAGILSGALAIPASAQVSVHITIPLPPPIVFAAPPDVVVLPETEIYVVPRVSEEIYFFDGWWWRPWQGRWYRSRHHDRGWAHFPTVPPFYRRVPPGWRDDYRGHRWGGGPWNYRPIPHGDLLQNWRRWHETRHWDQPEHRQHELHRDGRPYGPRERMEPRRGPEPPRRPERSNAAPWDRQRREDPRETRREERREDHREREKAREERREERGREKGRERERPGHRP